MRAKKAALIISAVLSTTILSGCNILEFFESPDSFSVQNNFNEAVKTCNIERAEEILKEHNYSQKMLDKAVYGAAMSGNLGYMDNVGLYWLMEKGANPNVRNTLFYTTYNAGHWGDTIALLTSDKINLNAKDRSTPALKSALLSLDEYNQYSQVVAMVERGFKPNPELFYDENDYAPSDYNHGDNHYMYRGQDPRARRYLLEKLLENGQESGMPKCVDYALIGKMDESLTELENYIARGNELDYYGKLLIQSGFTCYGTLEQYKKFIELISDVEYKFRVSYAIWSNNYEMMKYGFEELNTKISKDYLEIAAHVSNYEICEYIINQGIVTSKHDLQEILYMSIRSKRPEIIGLVINYIIQCGYEMSELDVAEAINQGYKGARYIEITEVDIKIMDIFLEQGYDLRYLEFTYLNKEIAEYLYSKGRPLNISDLYCAAYQVDADFVKLVFEQGANPNQPHVSSVNKHDWDIIDGERVTYDEFVANYPHDNHFFGVSFTNSSEICQMFIDYGLDLSLFPDIMEFYGMSTKTARILLENGANTDLHFDKLKFKSGGVWHGNFDLTDFYKQRCRKDLIELLKEFEEKNN